MAWPYEAESLVWGVTGNLGGGKTLSAVDAILTAFDHGWLVVTNIDLNCSEISKVLCGDWWLPLYHRVGDLSDVDPYDWPSGDPRGSGSARKRVVVVLDECAEWFDQYQSASSGQTKRVFSWLRHTSKRSQDVVFIIQRSEFLHKTFRILVERWCYCSDLGRLRLGKLNCTIPGMSGRCMRQFWDRSLTQRVGLPSTVQKSVVGRFYNTAQCLAAGGSRALVYDRPVKPPSRFSLLWPCRACGVALFFYFVEFLGINWH